MDRGSGSVLIAITQRDLKEMCSNMLKENILIYLLRAICVHCLIIADKN